ncbi:KTSC domain-containing protein [Herbaspirillum seropedicae]|uniref:KTSC domain-containing protein n=1 Tax=Herbaspirillum seropedicae TaxID=964 RepID=UPI001FD44E73|nr:KTSC domain-containing protein [Herbaspirillum seropedicae]
MQPVRSSAIAAVGYDPSKRELFIQFTSHPTTYTYVGVPITVYTDFMSASSKGQYYDLFIKDRYSTR